MHAVLLVPLRLENISLKKGFIINSAGDFCALPDCDARVLDKRENHLARRIKPLRCGRKLREHRGIVCCVSLCNVSLQVS